MVSLMTSMKPMKVKLPGLSKFFKVSDETYDSVLKIDSSDKRFIVKAKEYGRWLAKSKRLSSLLFITELFNDLGLRIKIVSTSPLILELNIKRSNFILGFIEGVFSEVYGVDFKFKVSKSKPLTLEAKVQRQTNKNPFIKVISHEHEE